jgi:GNAT superfamily N-acetyltransferase
VDTNQAWELFIRGFTDTAYARRVGTRFRAGPLEAVRFAGDEDRPSAPFVEFFVRASDPSSALAAVAAAAPPAEHYLTVLEDRPGLREQYGRGGYVLHGSETLMACDLTTASLPTPKQPVAVIRTVAEATWQNANDPQGISWVVPDNLADPRMAHYAIVRDGRTVCRGRTIQLDATHSYVSRVYTAEEYRGHGLATALMLQLLIDDDARGVRWSVLTATSAGEGLYARLGYRSLGRILIFAPTPERS